MAMREAFFYVPDMTKKELQNAVNSFLWLKELDHVRVEYSEEVGGVEMYVDLRNEREYNLLRGYIYELSNYEAEAHLE